MPNKIIDPAAVTHSAVALIALQRTRQKIAKARQEVDAHAGVEVVRIGAANREKADLVVDTERHQCRGSNFVRVFLK